MELASLGIRISRSENLPVLAQSASTVLRLVDDQDAGPRDIEVAIAKDPAITAKILKAANSAFYGGMKVPTIGRAVQFLGTNSVRSLVVGIAFQQMTAGKAEAASFNKMEFWKHCLAVATAARILARIKVPDKAEELYCAGIMHDVGMLVLDRFMPVEFQAALDSCRRMGRPLHLMEKSGFGFDHAEVGGLLGDHWGLPALMKNAILHHHNPIADMETTETTRIIASADGIAHRCGFKNCQDSAPHEFDFDLAGIVGLSEDHLEKVCALVTTEVEMAEAAMQG